MKKKLFILCILSTIICIIIYLYTKSNDVTLVSIGDSLSLGMTSYGIEGYSFNDYLHNYYVANHKLKRYIPTFAKPNQTIKDLIYEIKENKTLTLKNEKINIQHAINDADILTIAIGMDELNISKINSSYRQEFQTNFQELLSMIKMLNQKKVIVLGLYTAHKYDAYTIERLNAIIRDLTLSNNFIFLDINNILANKEYYLSNESYHLNYLGHKAIYQEIIKTL